MRALAFLLPMLIVTVLTVQVNHLLSFLQVHLFLAGLFVAYGSLQADRRSAVAAIAAAGFWLDASSPVPFGLHAAVMTIAALVIWQSRRRRLADEDSSAVTAALAANAVVFFVISFQQSGQAPSSGTYWLRAGVELAISEIVLALIARWFFALQGASLRLLRQEVSPVQRFS